jgi:TPR repeat protein
LWAGSRKKYSKALYLYEMAGIKGHDLAQNNAGYMYHRGFGVQVNYKEAMG